MGRFLAGVAAALLLVAAGFFIWKGKATGDDPIPPVPAAAPSLLARMPEQAVEAPANADKSREEQRFARYDKDKDGLITKAEMLESRRKAFVKLDTNGDARLSFEEWAVSTSEKFAKADADRSGGLNAAEFLTTKPKPVQKKCSC